MSRVGAIVALSLTTVFVFGVAIIWNNMSRRTVTSAGWVNAAPAASSTANISLASGASSDAATIVRQASDAIRGHDSTALAHYLAQGMDPNSVDGEGETLLNKAVVYGTPAVVELLLAAGADPDLPGKNGLGPLAIAALEGHRQMLDRLVAASKAGSEAAKAPAGDDAAAEAGNVLVDPATAAVVTVDDAPAAGETDGVDRPQADAPSQYQFSPPDTKTADGDAPSGATGEAALASAETASLAPNALQHGATGPVPTGASPASTGTLPAAAAPAQGDAVAPRPDQGAPKNQVLAAQKRLAQLGYYKGAVDGVAGPQTSAAIRNYQTVAGIAVNGLVSVELLTRIGATPEEAPETTDGAAAYRPPATGDAPPGVTSEEAEAQALQNVLNKFQTDLGQNFNSETRPEVLRRYCRQNTNTWVYDEATQRSVYCRDLVGLGPR